jgi:hypothetical protein
VQYASSAENNPLSIAKGIKVPKRNGSNWSQKACCFDRSNAAAVVPRLGLHAGKKHEGSPGLIPSIPDGLWVSPQQDTHINGLDAGDRLGG